MTNIKRHNHKKYKLCDEYVDTMKNPEKYEDKEME